MQTNRAAVVTKFGAAVEYWEVPFRPLEPGSMLIRIDAATLCGTDVHRWKGHLGQGGGDQPFIKPVTVPYVPGHETCGTVVETAGEVRDINNEMLRPGDRVVSSYGHCGHCYYCRVARQTTLCHGVISFGHSHPDKMLGGCAEYHYLPPSGTFIRVPQQVSAPLAASSACALRTVMHSFEQIGPVHPHETVLILGAGPLGLYAAAVAIDRGAAQVIVIGAPRQRLEVAKEWGVQHVIDLDEISDVEARVGAVRELSAGRGADVTINCATAHAFPEAMRMTRPGGRLAQVGASGGAPVQVPPMLFFRGVTVFTTVMAEARHFYQALDFLATRQQRFSFERMISGRYPLERTSEALEAMAGLREVKPVILPMRAN